MAIAAGGKKITFEKGKKPVVTDRGSGSSSSSNSSDSNKNTGSSSSSNSNSFETATQAVNIAVQKLVEQKQAEDANKKRSSSNISRVDTTPVTNIFGQQSSISTTSPIIKTERVESMGPQQPDRLFKQPTMISEPEGVTVKRGKLGVYTSNLQQDEKDFLLSTAETSPSSFVQYEKGSAEVKRGIGTTPSRIEENQIERIDTSNALTSNTFLNSDIRAFTPMVPTSVEQTGIKYTPEGIKTTLTLQPKGLDRIRAENEASVQRGQDFLVKTGLKEQSMKDITLTTSEDIFGQKSPTSSLENIERKYKPSEEVVLKSFADYENTNLKQQQLNKQIEEYNARPATQQDEREYNNLKKSGDDLSARYRMNPFVKYNNGRYMFESPIQSEVLAQQVSISQRPDIFIPNEKLQNPSTQFGKGFQEALAGRAIYEPISSEPNKFLGRYSGVVSGAVVSPFISSNSAKQQVRPVVSQPLQKLGVSEKSAERISDAALFGTAMVATAPVGGAIGRGIGSLSTKSTGVEKGLQTVSKITESTPGKYALGGLLVADVGLETKRGYDETGTIGGATAFGLSRGAELGAMTFPITAGIKGYNEKIAERVSAQGDIYKTGEGVDVTLTKGFSTEVRTPQTDVSRFVSESEGVIKIQGGKDIPIKVYTGAEGRPTIRAPELPQEGVPLGQGKLTLQGERTRFDLQGGQVSNQQLPEDIFRVTGGKIKVEFPGSSKKPVEFTQDVDYQTLPSERILGKAITYESVPRTRTAKDFIFEETTGKSLEIPKTTEKEYVLTSLTEKIPGIKDTSLQKSFFISQERPRLLAEDIVQIGETVSYTKIPVITETSMGTISMRESEIVSGAIQSKPGTTLTQTLKNMIGKMPGETYISVRNIQASSSSIKSPVGGTSVAKSIGSVKTPIGKTELKVSSPGQTKTPMTQYNSQMSRPSSGALQMEQKGVQQNIYPVSETQQIGGLQRLRQIIGEREALKFETRARGIREQPIKMGQTMGPITTLGQMKMYQQEKTRFQPEFQTRVQTSQIQDQQKLRDFIQIQTPIKSQITEQIKTQDTETTTDKTFKPITTDVTDLIKPTGGSNPTITPEKGIPFLAAGFPGFGGGFGGGFGFNNRNKFLSGIKINPIGAISKGFGKNIRGLK